ncbi:carbonic anhydrase [Ranunculus cassubicifolius]
MFTKIPHLLLISLLILSSIVFPQCRAAPGTEEVENEREFAYIGNATIGPKEWGKMHPEWETCSNGDIQSPIDISRSGVVGKHDLGVLKPKYKAAPASVKNRGHDIMVSWHGDAGDIKINGTRYSLKQLHWHSPAEHTFDGLRHQMEVHLVHETPQGKIAVVAITYDYGKSDPFLDTVIPHIARIGEEDRGIGVVDPRGVKMPTKQYYRYIGSLTVPPCTEGVVWTIVKKVKTVSKKQVHALRKSVHDNAEENARPLQQKKERKVWYYSHKSA